VLSQKSLLTLGTGAIDRHIKPSKPLDRTINQPTQIVLSAHICRNKLSLSAVRAKIFDQSLTRLIIAARNNESRALSRKRFRCGAADSRQCTGYKNDWRTHETS
jgi:hypothetical protein